LNKEKIKEILKIYWKDLGIENTNDFFENIKDKKYCILIFLEKIQKLKSPFEINKKWFWNMTSWINVEDINETKI